MAADLIVYLNILLEDRPMYMYSKYTRYIILSCSKLILVILYQGSFVVTF